MVLQTPTIIAKTTSDNLWWGLYGLCEKTGWEDLNLFYENGTRIGRVCLNTRQYLLTVLEDLQESVTDEALRLKIQSHLAGNTINYWYYYDKPEAEEFYQVPYEAPINDQGIKPRYTEIFHPDKIIDLKTIQSAVKAFASSHLQMPKPEVKIQNVPTIEASLQSFKNNQRLTGGNGKIEISLSENLISDLAGLWNLDKAAVKDKLESSHT